MERSFSQTLSALRKERNISQRQAAAELNISQALLSHYENGAREPGLNFVCRACDYYGVSADYLLGRSDKADPLKTISVTAESLLDDMQAIIDEARNKLEQLSTEEEQT